MQKALNRFRGRDFVILAISIHPAEDPLVLPFMKGNGYGFVPLKADEKWAEQNYKVRGTPQNFLIDSKGRVVFRPDVRSTEALQTLVNEIDALLLAAKK